MEIASQAEGAIAVGGVTVGVGAIKMPPRITVIGHSLTKPLHKYRGPL